MNVPLTAMVQKVELNEDQKFVLSKSEHTAGSIPLPALVTIEKTVEKPKLPKAAMIMKAYKQKVEKWGLDQLNMEIDQTGIQGSAVTLQSRFIAQT